ncbi:MAG: PASTA domain-containing protein [Bacteroidales bacterium]|nr:PASTA domain-containing protein [Bacteroidales bacterium]
MSKFTDFFRPQRMGFHLILAVIVTVVIVFMVAFLLKKYTHHGVEVTLPDYVGQNADALMNSDTTDFIFVVRNTVFDKNKPTGTIMAQDPLAGDKVKPGRKVFLTISNSKPKMVRMPQLAGAGGLRRAQNLLQTSGLVLENVLYVDSDMDAGLVVEQFYRNRPIAAGAMVEEGSKITLQVSAGKVNTDSTSLNLGGESVGNAPAHYSISEDDF